MCIIDLKFLFYYVFINSKKIKKKKYNKIANKNIEYFWNFYLILFLHNIHILWMKKLIQDIYSVVYTFTK